MIHLRHFGFVAGLFAAVLVSAAPSSGEELRLAISGYDPVAYFTDAKPVPGLAQFEHVWRELRWRFASSEHRARSEERRVGKGARSGGLSGPERERAEWIGE